VSGRRKWYEGQPEEATDTARATFDHVGTVDVWTLGPRGWIGCRLGLFLDEVNHSPTGFGWAYGGSGPAQLAYAILRDYLGDQVEAERLHQAFKRDIVQALPRGAWELDGEAIATWLEANT
jgi:hypothetical protein